MTTLNKAVKQTTFFKVIKFRESSTMVLVF